MAARVTAIPATLNKYTSAPVCTKSKRLVAGYARVSTDQEEQQSSYEAQMDYYKNYITKNPNWEFVGMYSDEGITATNTKHRDGFNRMIADALNGKIQLIVTKSISRFARNTVDSLTTVRKLKEKGVEVYFEKENIWTLDTKGELLITIMSSLAQEESRSISENTTWGRRKAFADGKVSVAYSKFLGYDEGFVINEKEAEIVRLIYKLYLTGMTAYGITKELKRRGIKTINGKEDWFPSTIKSVLTNEKYKGDALLQKGYTADFLQKKRKKNMGEVQKYYVEDHHEAIIDPIIFERVQDEIQKRTKDKSRYYGQNIFSSRIFCGECGGRYGRRLWHSNDKYRKDVYQCNQKYVNESKCHTPHLTEEKIKQLFFKALNKMLGVREETLANIALLREMASNTESLEKEYDQACIESASHEMKLRALIKENARVAQGQEEYEQKYNSVYEQYQNHLERAGEIKAKIREKTIQSIQIQTFMEKFLELDGEQNIFDEQLWTEIVDRVTVYSKEKVTFTFIGGIEVTVEF